MCEAMDMPIEGLPTETGAGVLEAAITVDTSLASADKAALFKTFTKVLAQRRGWMATFMAKWSKDWPGQSGHLHLSLKDKKGKGVFHDPKAPHFMSQTMRHFLAGQQALMPQVLAMISPTVNSYTVNHPDKLGLPATLWDAAQRLKASKPARALFGDAFVEHYAATREWEERENRKHISDWQLQRYFEII